jgi:hypothetical protein
MKTSYPKKLYAIIKTRMVTRVVVLVLLIAGVVSCKKDTTKPPPPPLEDKIVYTDVSPDASFNTSESIYHLDLNKDDISDFDISYATTIVTSNSTIRGSDTNKNILITPLKQNEVASNISNDVPVANLNDIIYHAAYTWRDSVQILASLDWVYKGTSGSYSHFPSFPHFSFHILTLTASGLWAGVVAKYIPVRLYAGGNFYYAWVRLDVDSLVNSFTVKDYGYNAVPNRSILAGQH